MSESLHVYGDSRSGNCYKVQLLCAELGLDYRWTEVDILAGETHTPDFLKLNPNGKIPLLVESGDFCLPESNAILAYLSEGHRIAGFTRQDRASVMSWMFFEQYSHEPYIATSRFIVKYLGNPPERRDALEEKRAGGYRALDVMEQRLATAPYLVGSDYSIADIALYAYTHVAQEGNFDLSTYPAINEWLARIQARETYVPMQAPSA